jgi:hypothetical protein
MISLITTTDSGLVCFWAAAWALLCRRHICWAGLVVGLAALYKWPAYLIWLFWLPYLGFQGRRQLLQGLCAVAISLLALMPSLVWNWQHGWATIFHVATQVAGKQQPILHGNFGAFLAGQIALFTPVAFVLWVIGFWRLRRSRGPLKVTAWTSGIILIVALVWSVFNQLHANWFLFLYPLAAVVVCSTIRSRAWLITAISTALFFSVLGLTIPYLQARNIGPTTPYKWNPLRQTMGWRELGSVLESLHFDPARHYLISDSYQMASLLSFYSAPQTRSDFINLFNRRRNQFCYWLPTATPTRTGLFLTTVEEPLNIDALVQTADFYTARLQPYYGEVEWIGVAPLFAAYDQIQLSVLIFELRNPTNLPPPCGSHY